MGRRDSFEFGKNWARFLSVMDEERIIQAEESLKKMLAMEGLAGKRFLDIGSGSGLFSLAARRMGAVVHSFDLDPHSVACTRELKRRNFPEDANWIVEQGSILDTDYLCGLGEFDIVYSWGVLHHTGAMWQAFENIFPLVRPGGNLFIAIYNDQGWISDFWKGIKKIYNRNGLGKVAVVIMFTPYFIGGRLVFKYLTNQRKNERGMSLWYDMVDWLGGYPFEVARPEDLMAFFRANGFALDRLKTAGGKLGCNEYVFRYPGNMRAGD